MENEETSSTKGILFKGSLLVIIIFIIVGIWFVKNNEEEEVTKVEVIDNVLKVSDAIDLEQLKSYGIPIIIDFGADTCVPCKEMAPVLVKLNEELDGKAIVKFVDVWEYPELAQDYPIKVIPTQLFFDKDGNPYAPVSDGIVPLTLYSTKADEKDHIYTTHEGGITEEELLAILVEMGMTE